MTAVVITHMKSAAALNHEEPELKHFDPRNHTTAMGNNQLFIQYLWFIIITIIVFILLNPRYKKVRNEGLTSSSNYPKWNSSSKPIWFLIVSDLHLGTVRPKSYEKVYWSLHSGLDTYHPHRVIIPGDVTDNYDGSRYYPYKKQMSEDWNLYGKLLSNLGLPIEKVIQVRGNHDVFKISSMNSSYHYGKEFFRYRNESEFHIQTFFYNVETSKIKFVLIHPYRFPIGPICYTAVDAFPTEKYYRQLDDVLQKNDSDITFLVTHYPEIAFSPEKRIRKIYSRSPNQRVVISGHWHKRLNTKIMHHGPTLELVISGIVKSNNIINILTIDNNRIVNHQIDLNNPDLFLMTNPVPYEMNLGNGFFNALDSEIRVLVFLKKDQNLPKLKFSIVENNSPNEVIREDTLKCGTKISDENNIYLCSAKLGLSEGNYTLFKSGDWSGEERFFIGNRIPPFYDTAPDSLPIWEWYYTFFIVAVFFSFVLFPYPRDFEWIFSRRVPKNSQMFSGRFFKNDFPFFGFFHLHHILYRSYDVPRYMTFALFFSFFYILFLPLSFFDIEGQICILFSWGYACKKKVLWHFLGGEIAMRAIYFIIAPVVFIATFYAVSHFSTASVLIVVLYEMFNLRWFVSLIFKLIDMAGIFYALTSPVIYLPIILYWALFKWIYTSYLKRKAFLDFKYDIPVPSML